MEDLFALSFKGIILFGNVVKEADEKGEDENEFTV